MLRLIHAQTVQGAVLVDDIDDGMPNKQSYRLRSDKKAVHRDGYANAPKQPCYVPRVKKTDPTVAGYIDLNQTQRVDLSAGKGKISKLKTAGLITVVSFLASDLAAPTLASATISGSLTLVVTNALSVAPNESKVLITGAGAVTLTRTAILGAGGTFTNTSVVIPAGLIAGVTASTSFVKVTADDQTTGQVTVA